MQVGEVIPWSTGTYAFMHSRGSLCMVVVLCSCTFCLDSCSATDLDFQDQPIKATDGFVWPMVVGVYVAVAVCTVVLFLYRNNISPSRRQAALLDITEPLLTHDRNDNNNNNSNAEGGEADEDDDEELYQEVLTAED